LIIAFQVESLTALTESCTDLYFGGADGFFTWAITLWVKRKRQNASRDDFIFQEVSGN
jgi:hypothetical protein